MKKIIYYCLALCVAVTLYSTGHAQVRKVPAEVTEAFRSKYPMATNIEWRDRLSGFTASFDLNNAHYEAKFTNKGFWQNTENKIPEAELPDAVKDGFQKSKYAEEWTIKNVYKIAMKEEKTQYRVEIEKNDIQKKHLFFDPNGRLLRDNIKL
ncbi:hypothetical protein FAM09_25070 [Niastella caeni]|uniref:Putative beta-lactamase-inhibitor-like PepSY-like domain-containing protein n=1 Tax=Niastella caeni TaxID=2569763 RepID=A0A4S8HF32_9BACT|nr:PepSY-like domain-containing protein [Niastella caeni]THU33425.1 hypothetical protein FAM09_25070 [Niastella caeni]